VGIGGVIINEIVTKGTAQKQPPLVARKSDPTTPQVETGQV